MEEENFRVWSYITSDSSVLSKLMSDRIEPDSSIVDSLKPKN